jgi:hypothetical protein
MSEDVALPIRVASVHDCFSLHADDGHALRVPETPPLIYGEEPADLDCAHHVLAVPQLTNLVSVHCRYTSLRAEQSVARMAYGKPGLRDASCTGERRLRGQASMSDTLRCDEKTPTTKE